MELYPVHITNFKVDGGVMFGVVPKAIWQKRYPADDHNLVNLSLRSLLVSEGERLILIDTGWGDKQDEDFFRHVHLNGGDGLEGGLAQWGFKPEDVTDVVLTHLHADHCGGALRKSVENQSYEPVFPHATIWVSRDQWNWAINPNLREKDAFLQENIMPLQESGNLRLVTGRQEIIPGFEVHLVNGHTPGQIIPILDTGGGRIIYAADLIPTAAHIPLLFNMAYDLFQLDTIKEKGDFLESAWQNGDILFFEHDVYYPCCNLKKTDKGIRADQTFTLEAYRKGMAPA